MRFGQAILLRFLQPCIEERERFHTRIGLVQFHLPVVGTVVYMSFTAHDHRLEAVKLSAAMIDTAVAVFVGDEERDPHYLDIAHRKQRDHAWAATFLTSIR